MAAYIAINCSISKKAEIILRHCKNECCLECHDTSLLQKLKGYCKIWLSYYSLLFTYIHTYPHDRDGRRGAMEEVRDSIRQACRSSATLMSSSSFRPFQSLMLSIHCFLCLPRFLAPGTVP